LPELLGDRKKTELQVNFSGILDRSFSVKGTNKKAGGRVFRKNFPEEGGTSGIK